MIYDLELSSKVKKCEDGITVAEYFANRFTYKDKNDWLNLIYKGFISINDKVSVNDVKLFAGDKVSYTIKDFYEPDLNCNYKIEYESENIVVVSKPANLPVQTSRRIFKQTMTAILRRDLKQENLNPLHRLDRETSGLVVYLKKPFEDIRFKKIPLKIITAKYYIAVLNGIIDKETIEVNVPLKEANDGIVNYKMIPSDTGLNAKSIFYKLSEKDGKTLVLVRILTGRKHQIRAHAAYINAPVLGDKLYYENGKYFLKRSRDELTEEDIMCLEANNHMLHAFALKLDLPEISEQYVFSYMFSDEMKKKVEELGYLNKARDIIINKN